MKIYFTATDARLRFVIEIVHAELVLPDNFSLFYIRRGAVTYVASGWVGGRRLSARTDFESPATLCAGAAGERQLVTNYWFLSPQDLI